MPMDDVPHLKSKALDLANASNLSVDLLDYCVRNVGEYPISHTFTNIESRVIARINESVHIVSNDRVHVFGERVRHRQPLWHMSVISSKKRKMYLRKRDRLVLSRTPSLPSILPRRP